jgi:hypothetical protein
MKTRLLLTLLVLLAESIACLAAFIRWPQWKGTPFRLFSLYLLFIVAVEAFAFYVNLQLLARDHPLMQMRSVVYKYLVIPAEFLSAFAVFYFLNRERRYRFFLRLFAAVYVLALLGNIAYGALRPTAFFTMAYMLGCAMLLILILHFLIRLAISDHILCFHRNILFWFCVGWLIFYLGAIPYYGLENTLAESYPALLRNYYYMVFYGLNVLMYLSIATGYLWGKPSLSSSQP